MSQRTIWGATLRKGMALQCGAVAGVAGITAMLGGNAALSLLCGGAAVVVPNLLLAAWLMPRLQSADSGGNAVALMVAEGVKLMGTTGLLLAAVVTMKAALVWPAFLGGIITALLANWVSLWVTRRY